MLHSILGLRRRRLWRSCRVHALLQTCLHIPDTYLSCARKGTHGLREGVPPMAWGKGCAIIHAQQTYAHARAHCRRACVCMGVGDYSACWVHMILECIRMRDMHARTCVCACISRILMHSTHSACVRADVCMCTCTRVCMPGANRPGCVSQILMRMSCQWRCAVVQSQSFFINLNCCANT